MKLQASITRAKFERLKLCSVTTLAMRPNRVTVTLRFSLLGAHNRPIWGYLAQFLKEGILLTSWYFMVVVKKGKISSVHTVASNCTQWKRQYEGCRLYWESVQLLTALAAGSLGFSRFGKIGQPHPSKLASLMFFPYFEIFEKSQMRGRIRKYVCWHILIPRVNNFLQNRLKCDPAFSWLQIECAVSKFE